MTKFGRINTLISPTQLYPCTATTQNIEVQEVKKPLLCTNTGVVSLTEWKSIGYQTLPNPNPNPNPNPYLNLTLTLNDCLTLISKTSASS